jgi:hypothetical protein
MLQLQQRQTLNSRLTLNCKTLQLPAPNNEEPLLAAGSKLLQLNSSLTPSNEALQPRQLSNSLTLSSLTPSREVLQLLQLPSQLTTSSKLLQLDSSLVSKGKLLQPKSSMVSSSKLLQLNSSLAAKSILLQHNSHLEAKCKQRQLQSLLALNGCK